MRNGRSLATRGALLFACQRILPYFRRRSDASFTLYRGCDMRMGWLVSAVGALLLVGGDVCAQGGYSFALIGDGPYAPEDSLRFEALIDEINADEDVVFVIHAGDIKNGSQPCTDDFLEGRLDILSRFEDPLILHTGGQRVDGLSSNEVGRVRSAGATFKAAIIVLPRDGCHARTASDGSRITGRVSRVGDVQRERSVDTKRRPLCDDLYRRQ